MRYPVSPMMAAALAAAGTMHSVGHGFPRHVGAWPPVLVGAWPPGALVGQTAMATTMPAAPVYAASPGLIGSAPGLSMPPALVSNDGPDTLGQYPMGFGPQTISKSGANTEVVSRNQIKAFTPIRLVVIDSTANPAAFFSINQILIGQKACLLNGNPIPGAAFTQVATDSLVTFVTSVCGQDLTIEVANTDTTTDHIFQAMMLGRSVGV